MVAELSLDAVASSVRSLISDTTLHDAERSAALETLSAIADVESAPEILTLVQDPNAAYEIRLGGVRALVQLRHQASLQAAMLDDEMDAELRTMLVDSVARDVDGATWLYRLCENGVLTKELRERAVSLGVTHLDPSVRAIYLQNVPEAERPAMLGSTVDPTEIFSLEGDATRGAGLFLSLIHI